MYTYIMASVASSQKYTAFCVKCKKMVEVKDPQIVTTKNGRLAVKGKCPYCGSTVFKFISKEESAK